MLSMRLESEKSLKESELADMANRLKNMEDEKARRKDKKQKV